MKVPEEGSWGFMGVLKYPWKNATRNMLSNMPSNLFYGFIHSPWFQVAHMYVCM
jgi:hypothetical protein